MKCNINVSLSISNIGLKQMSTNAKLN
jgi:hypothetical protein